MLTPLWLQSSRRVRQATERRSPATHVLCAPQRIQHVASQRPRFWQHGGMQWSEQKCFALATKEQARIDLVLRETAAVGATLVPAFAWVRNSIICSDLIAQSTGSSESNILQLHKVMCATILLQDMYLCLQPKPVAYSVSFLTTNVERPRARFAMTRGTSRKDIKLLSTLSSCDSHCCVMHPPLFVSMQHTGNGYNICVTAVVSLFLWMRTLNV